MSNLNFLWCKLSLSVWNRTFSARASSPSFTCWQVPSRPVFYLHPCRVKQSETRTVPPHPDLLSPDPVRAHPKLLEWTWRAACPRSSPSVSPFPGSCRTGTVWALNVSVVFISPAGACVFTHTRNKVKAAELNWSAYVFVCFADCSL